MNYRGFTNYETYNVALWIGQEEELNGLAQECDNYEQFLEEMSAKGMEATPDGVSFEDASLNKEELDEFIEGLKD